MRTPNLNSLKVFDAAARHLNFRRAADELNVTQGAVAQQIRRLEADLGTRLFIREARGLAFTEAGRRYCGPVHRALSVIDEATQQFSYDRTGVTLSVTPSFASKWLVPRLPEFARENGHIELQIVASENIAKFRNDGVDVAIRQGPEPVAAGIQARRVSALDLVAVCSPAHARTLPPTTALEAFANLQLVQDGHRHWETLFEEVGLDVKNPIMRFNQTALAMDAAANGQGIALAPALLVAGDIADGKLVSVWHSDIQNNTGFYLVYPAKTQPGSAPDQVVEWILKEACR